MENTTGQDSPGLSRTFLQKCVSIEETVAAIYRGFLETVPCDEELKTIWLRMAGEEDDHAAQIRLALRLPIKEAFRGQKVSMAQMEQLLNRARSILEGVRSSPPRVEDALRIAMKLEQDFLHVHIESAAEFAEDSLRRMFAALGQEDEKHKVALEGYFRKHFARKNPGAGKAVS
ncbi:ferritin family protein [uncultured Desulfuromonas sp.]|uniref:ferritin family protein n=1 Tax=uncultured Desulfuromonas sp. TaxID=181013 RepID=UPI002610864B|nr:ferritin family protein [uncultured Desulfuromonas sp.]